MPTNTIKILAKVKFDLRDPDEVYFSHYEIDSLLNTNTEFIKTIATLTKIKPFNLLDEEIIHLINRLVYMGEGQAFLAEISPQNIVEVVKRATFFREIFVIFETSNNTLLKNTFEKIGVRVAPEQFRKNRLEPNAYTQIFLQSLSKHRKLITIRFIPFQTLFEYVTEVKKLPSAVFRPKNSKNWNEYFIEKENGINKGISELIAHLKDGHHRAPHFGLGKNHIGDYVDWASTDLRKPFLHYLHKYKGKGDPRISRALINLLKVKPGDTILDPFVGSGAFIADAQTMGINAIGIDILNISKLIAEVKCNLGINILKLRNAIVDLFEMIDEGSLFKQNIKEELNNIKEKIKVNITNNSNRKIDVYLDKILFLKREIENIKENDIKKFLLVLLSQQIVEYSEKDRPWDLINSFRAYVEDRYLILYATQKMADILGVNLSNSKINIIKGDSTNMTMLEDNSIDGIVTSPPYFDALDYIGNNKFSILILNLDEDLKVISTKEFYNAKYRDDAKYNIKSLLVSDKYHSINLPESSLSLVKRLMNANRISKANIVENYLKMMKLSFEECYRVLKKDKYYLMVISKYHLWVINGKEELIDTSKILSDLGESVGFKKVGTIEHGLSKADKGKIGAEDILVFQK